MLRVVLVDLVDTLVVDGAPAPAATDALAVLAELDAADGEPLRVAVLGDPQTASVVDDAGLRRYVETAPSAGFEAALAAFGAEPADALAITAVAERAAESRAAGLPVVCLGVDVPDWSGVPAVVARLVDPDGVEQATFVRSLRTHGQLAEPGADAPDATHSVDDEGRIRRDRFRSI
ncbi:hypothetical protein ACQEVB_03240 [Pseudonocardia sp. CA-107938]|uniref:hypothetical protein n=1 Tax=Pseudonocardia sp. CA-107938 TaxID=3240021 RepID=UPI003D901E64